MIEPDKYYSLRDLKIILGIDRRTAIAELKTTLNPTGIPFLRVGVRGQYRMLGRDILKVFKNRKIT